MPLTVQNCSGAVTYSASPVFAAFGNSVLSTYSTEANAKVRLREAGTVKNMFVYVNTHNANAVTLITRKNGANGGLSISISGNSTGIFEDTSGSDTITAGDDFNYQFSGTSINIGISQISTTIENTNVDCRLVAASAGAAISTLNVTRFMVPSGALAYSATESLVQFKAKQNATVKNLAVFLTANTSVASTTVKSRKNTADGAISVSIGTLTTGLFEDTSNSDSLVTGDLFNTAIVTGATTVGITITTVKILFETTNLDCILPSSSSGVAQNSALTTYFAMSGGHSSQSTETLQQLKLRKDGIGKNVQVRISVNTLNGITTFTVRNNAADTNQAVSVTTTSTGLFEDTSDTTTFATTDKANWKVVTAGSSGSITFVTLLMFLNVLYLRTPSESAVAVVDSGVARKLIAARSITDSGNSIVDSGITRIPKRVLSITESGLSIVDSGIIRLLTAKRTITETAKTIVDSGIVRVFKSKRTITESAVSVASDAISRVYKSKRTLTESGITVGTDTVTRKEAEKRSITETGKTITDIVTRRRKARTLLVEHNSIFDAKPTRTRKVPRTITESNIAVTDTVSKHLVFHRVITDAGLIITDVVARLKPKVRRAFVNLTKRNSSASLDNKRFPDK
jgi:hypothetical protein